MNTYIIYMLCPFGDYDDMGNFDGDTEAEAIQAAIDFYGNGGRLPRTPQQKHDEKTGLRSGNAEGSCGELGN